MQVIAPTRAELELTDEIKVREFLSDARPSHVIHTAAKVGGIKANIAEPFEFLLRNLQIDSTVFSACDHHNINNLLYIGSSCMYPKSASQPFLPESLFTGALEDTNESYALAKLSGSKLAQTISAQKSRTYRTVILSNLYGPGDHFDSVNSHLVAAIISKVSKAKSENLGEIKIGGTGTPRREFTFVNDVADWISDYVDKLDLLPDFLNLGAGLDYSVREYYEITANVLGYFGDFSLDNSFADGMPAKLMDSNNAKSNFNWNPGTSLEKGIAITYEWWTNDRN